MKIEAKVQQSVLITLISELSRNVDNFEVNFQFQTPPPPPPRHLIFFLKKKKCSAPQLWEKGVKIHRLSHQPGNRESN